ncbi:hypothetical protein HGM15179_004665 [Zosterops borbonicus]|uniref:T22D1 protein n=1 Tax=Zosterops borbonicus TaxID=364589 RepID=A0A8K1LQV9_9PASS|nr:hypothetical protein HGM15179_004665 [Zosterops borbonicus]
MKKKSGFQITSVTPAQISASMSSNNSIAEDTESYDDLDESHTEDLSSSEILDVSLSRATDLGEPERSSSEETLNNFQEAETPGAVSPNQPHLPQQHAPLPHHPQQSVVINGSVHPHHVHHHHHLHHHHHGHHHPSHPGVGSAPVSGGPPPSPSFRKLSTTGSSDNVISIAPVSAASSTGSPASAVSNIRTTSTPGNLGISPAAGTSTLNNIGGGSSSVASNVLGTINLSNIMSTGNVNALSGTNSNANVNILSGVGNGTSASSSVINNVTNPTAGMAVGSSQQQPASGTSRFRVVKLDSSSEPFKKGRWTCTEFYDKENTVAVSEGVAVNKAVETIKQNPLEVTSERESTSGSSVSSNVSTLSHYTESVGSGEMGAPTVVQQQAFQGVGPQMDFSSAAPPAIPASSIPQSVSQSQLAQVQLHSQEVNYPQQKPGVQPPAQASLTTVTGVQPAPVNILGVSPSLGHQQPALQSMAQQQLPYSQPAQPVQPLPVVQQQQLQYGQQQQQPQQQPVPAQMAAGHVKPVNQNSVTGAMPDYIQHQQILQTPAPAMQPSSTGVGTGQPVPVAQAQGLQPSVQAHPAAAPAQPVAHAPAAIPGVAASGQMLNVGQQGSVAAVVQPPSATNQIPPPVMPSTAAPPSSQVVQPVQTGIMQQGLQASATGLPQQMVIAQQNTLLPVQPQAQGVESVVQGMTGQQLPAVSPIPSASTVPAPSQAGSAVPPGIPSASVGLGQPQNIAQASAVPNGSLAQSVSQPPPLISTSIGMPVAQSVPQQMPLSSTQFPAQSLAQSIASQMEDGRRPTEPSLVGLPQAAGVESGGGASAASDGSSSNMPSSASLFPLKVLPLTTPLVDGEDER